VGSVSRGCPQGSVLSPLLWCLLVADLVTRLNGGRCIPSGGYADDIVSSSGGDIPKHIVGAHTVGPPHHTDLVLVRSVCQLIPRKLNLYLKGKRTFLVSFKLFSL
jgi:hypothetical protein